MVRLDRDFCLRGMERFLVDTLAVCTRMLADVRLASVSPDGPSIFALLDNWIGLVLPDVPAQKARRGFARTVLFWLAAIFHLFLVAAYISYPVVFVTRRHDWMFFTFTVVCIGHWFIMAGECWVGYLEKRLTYDGYKLGSAPCRNWFFDVMPAPAAVALMAVLATAVMLAYLAVFLRNAIPFVVSYCMPGNK
jgi:hypothetical protein